MRMVVHAAAYYKNRLAETHTGPHVAHREPKKRLIVLCDFLLINRNFESTGESSDFRENQSEAKADQNA